MLYMVALGNVLSVVYVCDKEYTECLDCGSEVHTVYCNKYTKCFI